MSDQQNEKPENDGDQLNGTNDDTEIVTLEEILNQQREIDEVNYWNAFRKCNKCIKRKLKMAYFYQDVAAVLDGSDENVCTYSQVSSLNVQTNEQTKTNDNFSQI